MAKAKVSTKKTKLPTPLTSEQTYKSCAATVFKFSNVQQLKNSHDIIGQERAVRSIDMGLGIRKPGYNIYVAGHQGTGKNSVIKSFLEKWSKNSPSPNDWIYVYDFDKSKAARAMEIPRGEAKTLKKKMDGFVKDLKREIPEALQSEDYENAVNTYVSASNDRKAKLFTELEKMARGIDFTIKSTRLGIETVPILNGRTITEKEYSKLDEEQRSEIELRRGKLEPEVLDFARKLRNIEVETKDYVEQLRNQIGESLVDKLLTPIMNDYQDPKFQNVLDYLHKVRENVLENLLDFMEVEEVEDEEQAIQPEYKENLKKYTINVFVDNAKTAGAPVVIETNPTYYNLFGKVEKNVEHGIYQTDFTMIKSGAIQRANGGYLVLNSLDIFKTSAIWETLKRVLRNQEAFIEDMGEQYSLLPTSGLKPEAIPLDVKVILIGNEEIYHLLLEEDEEFRKLFKIKADFDYKMTRDSKNINSYASFIATRSSIEDLLPFDKTGIAAVIEYSSRAVEDQRLLSSQFGVIKDLTIEADFVAREQGSKTVKRSHVEEALDQKFYRLNLFEQHLSEMIRNGDILLDVDGERIGQVNGLTVYDMGDYSFGKICRITCTTSVSDDGIINIERASRLSGRTHDKGMMILTGYLNAVLAREHALGVSASVCFEQSYGLIDGDSASTAELIAIISAMGEIPVKQNFAITGSINQMGEIQAVGGINEKIEGFFKVVQTIGKGKQYNLIIPAQNVPNLMLHRDVRDGINAKILKIYPVKYLWEAFELSTGMVLGCKDVHDTSFSKGSAFDIISAKLKELYTEEEKEPQPQKPSSPKALKSVSTK